MDAAAGQKMHHPPIQKRHVVRLDRCKLFQGLDALFEPLRADGPAALQPGGVALHAGAEAAYRELGYLS